MEKKSTEIETGSYIIMSSGARQTANGPFKYCKTMSHKQPLPATDFGVSLCHAYLFSFGSCQSRWTLRREREREGE